MSPALLPAWVASAAADALLAAGVLELAISTDPLPGAATIAAGLLLRWRARLAVREARWDAMTRPEEESHDARSTDDEEEDRR
jgi:hypothetical protein